MYRPFARKMTYKKIAILEKNFINNKFLAFQNAYTFTTTIIIIINVMQL